MKKLSLLLAVFLVTLPGMVVAKDKKFILMASTIGPIDAGIVGALEANPAEQRISHQSPVGQALMGRKPGDKVVVSTPMGRSQLVIVSVT